MAKIAGLVLAVLIPFRSTLIDLASRWWAAEEYALSATRDYKEPRRYEVSIENTTKNKPLEAVQAYVSAGPDALTISVNRNAEQIQQLDANPGARVGTSAVTLYPGDRFTVEVVSRDRGNLALLPKIDFQAKGIRAGDFAEIQAQMHQSQSKRQLLGARFTEILFGVVALFCLGAALMIWRLEGALRRAQADVTNLRSYLAPGSSSASTRIS